MFFMTIRAQKAIVFSAGEISDADFSVSYSIGQISQETAQGTEGFLNQGVQQPFDIFSAVLDVPEFANINVIAYPNPTISFVNLSISNLEIVDASYYLFDLQGKVLKNSQINSLETIIEMGNYPVSTYFLKVQKSNGSILKTFKIIKN